MRALLLAISMIALAGAIVPSLLYWQNLLSLEISIQIALVATIVWFAVTPFWMGQPPGEIDQESPTI